PLVPRSNRGRPTTYFDVPRDGSLAQSVEQRTFNPLVPRSNRGRPTIFYRSLIRNSFRFYSNILNGPVAQSVEQRTFNPLVPRSNRGRPTILLARMIFY